MLAGRGAARTAGVGGRRRPIASNRPDALRATSRGAPAAERRDFRDPTNAAAMTDAAPATLVAATLLISILPCSATNGVSVVPVVLCNCSTGGWHGATNAERKGTEKLAAATPAQATTAVAFLVLVCWRQGTKRCKQPLGGRGYSVFGGVAGEWRGDSCTEAKTGDELHFVFLIVASLHSALPVHLA